MKTYSLFVPIIFSLFFVSCQSHQAHDEKGSDTIAQNFPNEQYRPQFHFTPEKQWTNDPNGLVYEKGTYHLFYQYFPDSNVWGPMHWGHATSTDLVHWAHKPIALYPDEYGYIFSGSAVADNKNTSGLGTSKNPPLIAIFTYHNINGERAGRNDYQTQGLAYSTDNGDNWKKYDKNPVLKNPGIKDFRDPKVSWNETANRWIMTLAVQDHVRFYSSPDLIHWTLESEFGKEIGAHGGVWECPDLFQLPVNDTGKKAWVLLVSINPGGPNGGSATQYFIGDFDGHKFTPFKTDSKWIDYGADDYAGVTWSGTGERKIFLGWMSNWLYANKVPTFNWRGAMTLPRDLKIFEQKSDYFLASSTVKEFDILKTSIYKSGPEVIIQPLRIDTGFMKNLKTYELEIELNLPGDFNIVFSNNSNDSLIVGFSKEGNIYYIDRTRSGVTDFSKEFPGKHYAPRISANPGMSIRMILDVASIELFADDGLTVMTEIFFPGEAYNKIQIIPDKKLSISNLQLFKVSSMYN